LVWVLVAVAAFGAPVYYMDAALAASRAALAEEQAALAPLRRQAAGVRELEAQVAMRAGIVAAASDRLIAAQPFATIQAALMAAAKQSGVQLGALVLEGPAAVPDLPGLARYQATGIVSGDRNQFLAFLRLLEHHPLLIEVPEVSLRMQSPTVRGVVPRVEQVLELGFYASSPGPKR
jgi:hypothetical protein